MDDRAPTAPGPESEEVYGFPGSYHRQIEKLSSDYIRLSNQLEEVITTFTELRNLIATDQNNTCNELVELRRIVDTFDGKTSMLPSIANRFNQMDNLKSALEAVEAKAFQIVESLENSEQALKLVDSLQEELQQVRELLANYVATYEKTNAVFEERLKYIESWKKEEADPIIKKVNRFFGAIIVINAIAVFLGVAASIITFTLRQVEAKPCSDNSTATDAITQDLNALVRRFDKYLETQEKKETPPL